MSTDAAQDETKSPNGRRWRATKAAAAARPHSESGRIDSLLGFDRGAASDSENSGVMALINSALSYERLPMLDIVFDRLVRMIRVVAQPDVG